MNRLTITLDDELYAMARAYAVANRKSISKSISDLIRQGRAVVQPGQSTALQIDTQPAVHPLSGFPIVKSKGNPITSEDVRRAEEEDIYHLEMMGLSRQEIKPSLSR
jgi:hypothetical protein